MIKPAVALMASASSPQSLALAGVLQAAEGYRTWRNLRDRRRAQSIDVIPACRMLPCCRCRLKAMISLARPRCHWRSSIAFRCWRQAAQRNVTRMVVRAECDGDHVRRQGRKWRPRGTVESRCAVQLCGAAAGALEARWILTPLPLTWQSTRRITTPALPALITSTVSVWLALLKW